MYSVYFIANSAGYLNYKLLADIPTCAQGNEYFPSYLRSKPEGM